MSVPSTLPIVIIFERHWDDVPKQVVKELLPELKDEGYKAFCVEILQNLSESEIISSAKAGLEEATSLTSQVEELLKQRGIEHRKLADMEFEKLAELMRLYVSSKEFNTVAETMKDLPAALLINRTFEDAKKLQYQLKGVDTSLKEEFSIEVTKRMQALRKR